MSATPPPSTIPSASTAVPTKLYRHVLEHSFSFCTLHELHTLLSVSRDWHAAVSQMKPLATEHCCRSPAMLPITGSLLARHVGALYGPSMFTPQLDVLELPVIAHACPHLSFLCCSTLLRSVASNVHFPLRLKELQLKLVLAPSSHASGTPLLNGPREVTEMAALILESLRSLVSLEKMNLVVRTIREGGHPGELSLSALMALPHLTLLHIDLPGGLNARQVAELRSMTRLQSALAEGTSLHALLAQPHQLQWEAVSLHSMPPWDLDDALAALASGLPSLTFLNAIVKCTDFAWLEHLMRLKTLDLRLGHVRSESTWRALVEVLAAGRCTAQLTDLHLWHAQFANDEDMALILAGAPQLRGLHLTHLNGIVSLDFLTAVPSLANTLRVLAMTHVPLTPVPPSTVDAWIRGLPSLLWLELMHTCELTDSQVAHFRALPASLRYFCYLGPDSATGDPISNTFVWSGSTPTSLAPFLQ
jgi:hypothetical protein